MKLKRWASIIFGICMLAFLITGCSSNDNSSTNSSDMSGKTIYGQVQSISGKSITLLLGEMSQNDIPQGEAPSADSSAAAQDDTATNTEGTPSKGDAPAMPSGSAAPQGEAPSGGAPSMLQGGTIGSQFIVGTEKATITVSDSVSIVSQDRDQQTEATLEDIVQDAILEVTFDDSNVVSKIVIMQIGGEMVQNDRNGGQSSQSTNNGTAATTISSDESVTGTTYTSSGDDENALRIDAATVTLDSVTIEKTGGSSSDSESGDFYGTNAGLLAQNGATVTIKNAAVTTSAQNGNGVFSYGEGTSVNVSDTTIRTSADNSGGIQTTGGAVMNASNLDVETQGNSSAAIRSDRGGGTVTVDGGTYVSNGTGSPAIYSTAEITVKNATLIANNSEAMVVEGKNSIMLTDCDVMGNMSGTYNDSREVIHNVMIYQSMSGDADVGQASFSMTGGSLTAKAGDMFYVTNTSCVIELRSVALTLANDVFLRVAGNESSRGWGESGSNGGTVVFTAAAQQFTGKIVVDDISSLDMNITEGSTFTGTINTDGQAGDVSVKLESTSTWALTGDVYITSFDGNVANITSNGYTVYVNGTAIN